MSANQIPRPGGGRTHDMRPDPTEHSCPGCWRNGGIGHHFDHLVEQQEMARARAALEPQALKDLAVYLTAL
ncbi:hypothetical protein ACWEJ6_44625 [Nonomuraea sp. NPDC004702]